MILAQVFHDIKTNGRRYVFTGGGDSTFNRGNGFGEWGAFLEQAKAHAPCIGGFGGMNVNGSGMNYLWAMRRTNNTAVGATTAPADPECLGGIVNPSGWTGFLHCLLAAAGTTISSTNWNWTANASFVNAHGRVVASMFTRAVSGATDANTGYTPIVTGGSALDVSASPNGTRQAAGTLVNTSSGTVGTLRRTDMESEQITATAASGIGASFAIGDGGLRLGGPALFLYAALTVKDTPKGWWASKHISLGGKALYDYIEEGLSTASYADSIETYFRCMLLLNDPTYANSFGGCQGDVTPGGLGGADLAIGCLWVDCFMHNDVGSAGNICSFVPDGEESWAAEATGTIVAHNTGAGTVTLDAGQGASFDTSGHIKTAAGEIITYTGKSTDTLTGCTFATFGTTAEPRDTFACYQGYLSYTATGFAANNHFWDDWLRARWAAAGGAAANFKRILKASMPVIDEVASTAGVVSTLPQREQRHRDMIAAVRSRSPSPLFEVVDPRDTITARDMVVNRWADVNATATLGASGVTSTAGDTINCGAGLSTSGVGRIGNEAFKWTGKSGNNPTGCTRGAFGTTAYDTGTPSHTSGREIVELDMIHSSTMGYQEFWRRKLLAELGSSSSIFELEGL